MAHAGGKPSKAHDVEEVEFLLRQQQGVAYILQAINAASAKSAARNMARYGRHDLASIFNTQSTLVLDRPNARSAPQ